jgi:hypothetical protein
MFLGQKMVVLYILFPRKHGENFKYYYNENPFKGMGRLSIIFLTVIKNFQYDFSYSIEKNS